jgi:hypothetical protein
MAFSESQKVDIRFYLGYPDVYRYANPRLESAIEVVGGRPESQTKVEVLLAKLNALYGAGANSPLEQQVNFAGLKKVESADDVVEFGGDRGSGSQIQADQSNYGKKIVSALSSFMGIPIASDIFGKQGYLGDNWKYTSGTSTGFGFGGMGFGY